jgi:hypothetical protein
MKEFRYFDATLYSGQQNPLTGFRYLPLIYEVHLWGKEHASKAVPDDLETFAAFVTDAARKSDTIVLDVERLPITGAAHEVSRSLEKLLRILQVARRAAPLSKFGYYSLVPIRDYWRAVRGPSSKAYKSWQRENDALHSLANAVDLTFPSLYTFYNDKDGWKTFARAQIDEARRVAPDRPVFPFLWPRFHESNRSLQNAYIDAAFWRMQLDFCRDHADGLVIWGGFKETWNERADWWQETLRFKRQMDSA